MRISRAIFTNDAKSAVAYPYVWQWDFGKIIKIYGLDLPEEFDAHLYEDGGGEALALIGTENSVMIPDAFLESGRNLTLYLYLHEQEDDGETVQTVFIPVHERAKPDEKTDHGSNHVEGEHRKYINLYATAVSDYEHWKVDDDIGSASYVIDYGTPKTIYATSEFQFEDADDELNWASRIETYAVQLVAVEGVIDMEDMVFHGVSFDAEATGIACAKAVGNAVFDAVAFMDEPDPEVRFETSLEVQIQSEDG